MKNLPVVLQKISKDDKDVVKNLLQFYLYDYSETDKRDINKWGVFEYEYLDTYFNEDKNRETFFIKLNDIIVGFLMINKTPLRGVDNNIRLIEEFFVMKKYRRIGIGIAAVKKIINKYPGKWEIEIAEDNDMGLKFWQKNIKKISGGKWNEKFFEKDGKKIYRESFEI